MYGLGDVRFFDRIAPLYDRVMPPADGETLAAGLDHATRPIDRLLDIGGGSGRAAAALTGPDITVVDASLGMLARAREHRGLSGVAGDAGGFRSATDRSTPQWSSTRFTTCPIRRPRSGKLRV